MTSEDVIRLFERPLWHAQAECVGLPTKWFFPERGIAVDRRAHAACANCPVATECAAAGRYERFGTWGGITAKNRRPGVAA